MLLFAHAEIDQTVSPGVGIKVDSPFTSVDFPEEKLVKLPLREATALKGSWWTSLEGNL